MAPAVIHLGAAVAALLPAMAIILLGPMSPAVVLASTVVSTAMVLAQDVFEKAHGIRPSLMGDILTSKS